jgi:hypothetical protein
MRTEGLGNSKISKDPTGHRILNLPSRGAVPTPTVPPLAPIKLETPNKISYNVGSFSAWSSDYKNVCHVYSPEMVLNKSWRLFEAWTINWKTNAFQICRNQKHYAMLMKLAGKTLGYQRAIRTRIYGREPTMRMLAVSAAWHTSTIQRRNKWTARQRSSVSSLWGPQKGSHEPPLLRTVLGNYLIAGNIHF